MSCELVQEVTYKGEDTAWDYDYLISRSFYNLHICLIMVLQRHELVQQRHILTFEFSVECSCVSAEGSLSYPPQKKHFTGSLATAFCILYFADVKP